MKKYIKYYYQVLVIVLSCIYGVLLGINEAYITYLTLIFFLYSLAINMRSRKILYIWVILPISVYFLFLYSDGFESKYIQDFRTWTGLGFQFLMMSTGYMTGYFISKCKTKTVYLTFLIVITILLFLLGNLVSWPFSFMSTGLIFLIAPYISYRFISQKLYIPLIIVAPLTLIHILFARSLYTLPLLLIHIFSVGIYYFVFFLKRKRIAQITLICIYTMFLIYGWYKGFEDYQQWTIVQKAKLPQDTYAEYIFYDVEGQLITSFVHQDKIVVFDFWTTTCGVCFEKFPEFEKVHQKYKHRDDIFFYAVNLPTKWDTKESIMNTIEKHVNYSFPVLLAEVDSDYWTQFKIKGVPQLVIIDKRGNVFYNGGANYEKKSAYYIGKIIDELLENNNH